MRVVVELWFFHHGKLSISGQASFPRAAIVLQCQVYL